MGHFVLAQSHVLVTAFAFCSVQNQSAHWRNQEQSAVCKGEHTIRVERDICHKLHVSVLQSRMIYGLQLKGSELEWSNPQILNLFP